MKGLIVAIVYLFTCIAIVLGVVGLIFFTGWVDMNLWNWFMAAYLHLPPMTIAGSIGFGLVTSTHLLQLNKNDYAKDPEKAKQWWRPITDLLLTHIVMLTCGWCVVHSGMQLLN